tara:strand:+ start:451 stop:717 length:267 start_codon:yes stop_codon:yes gene_type:complete
VEFVKRTDTQSLAKLISEESKLDLRQIKDIRNASYRSGYAMAANNLRNYLRSVKKSGEPIDAEKLMKWAEECLAWRNNISQTVAPDIV